MRKRLLLTIAVICSLLPSAARDFYGYTHEDPLVIVCDWDFQPFEFINSNGEPAGYNVDVLNLILDHLEIPHQFVMREWHEATMMFERREADLIHALSLAYKMRPYVQTRKYINYYNVKTARLRSTPPLKSINDLTETDTVVLKRDDYAMLRLQEMPYLPFGIVYESPREGLTGVRNGAFKYYIWGEIPLTRKIQELNIDSLVLDDIDIPAGELCIIGYDNDIIDVIDDQYTRLEQAGELRKIYDKWFHPERVHDDASPVALFVLVGIAIIVVVVFLLSRLTRARVKSTIHRSNDLNHMMTQALAMGEFFVVEWDIENNILRNKYGDMLPPDGLSPKEYLARMEPEEAMMLHDINIKLMTGQLDHSNLHLKLNRGTAEHPDWREYTGAGTSEKIDGKIRFIVYSAKDITREREEEYRNQMLGSKYMKIFDTNLLAMSFYGPDGMLIDINQKMRDLVVPDEESERYFRTFSMFDDPGIKGDFDPNSRDVFHICRHVYLPAIGIDKYIETRIRPTYNEDRLVYYVLTAREVTAERDMYMKQREQDRMLRATHDNIDRYEQQLRYLLEESNMYVWIFDIEARRIEFSRTLRKPEFSETLEEYFSTMNETSRQSAISVFHDAVLQGKPFNAVHFFDSTPVDQQPVWYSISGIPLHEADGSIRKYYGAVRNITRLMDIQEQLRQETSRAEDSGRLKAAFLANMTHEIRTPLNAIVGFSSLLQMVDTDEERKEFIRIIRNNCDMLLRLINDILEASSMGQSLAIEPEAVDLSKVFDDICQTLAQRVQEPGVEFQKDNPLDICPAVLDKGRLQQVLTNFVTNAVKYTHEGHIRVGYRSERRMAGDVETDGFYFYCEDTGAGIPKEKQASVFERFVKLNDFVQGTGLGLSICKAIIEKCNGQIGVEGEVGIGSTFWFWIPAELKV